jgi:hypothetical protein
MSDFDFSSHLDGDALYAHYIKCMEAGMTTVTHYTSLLAVRTLWDAVQQVMPEVITREELTSIFEEYLQHLSKAFTAELGQSEDSHDE